MATKNKVYKTLTKKHIVILSIGIILVGYFLFSLWMSRPLPSPLVDGSGSCIIRSSNVDIPEAGAPNIGNSYVKLPKQNVKTAEELQRVCTKEDYQRLAWFYCQKYSQPYQEQVVTYNEKGQVHSGHCGAYGCNLQYCLNIVESAKSHISRITYGIKLDIAGFNDSGACIIRNESTNNPDFLDPDVGSGYAKKVVPGAKSISDLRTTCNEKTYKELLEDYCRYNDDEVTASIMTFDSEGHPSNSACSSLGCGKKLICP